MCRTFKEALSAIWVLMHRADFMKIMTHFSYDDTHTHTLYTALIIN